jgi:hypothetical protein
MKKVIYLFTILGFATQTINAQVEVFTSDYIALTVPQHFYGEITYVNDSLFQETKDMSEIKNDKTLLRSLPNIVSNVTVYEVEQNGDLKVLGIGISGKNKVYQVIYDYSQTQTLVWGSGNNAESVLVGVGVRMVAKVKTKKAGINLSSPFGLTADTKKVEGSLEVRVTGISSHKINGLIPTTTDLSPSSISVALQAVATIKSHIHDEETIITPQYLGYNKIDNTIRTENIKTQKIN